MLASLRGLPYECWLNRFAHLTVSTSSRCNFRLSALDAHSPQVFVSGHEVASSDETLKLPVLVGPYRVLRPLAEELEYKYLSRSSHSERSVALEMSKSGVLSTDFCGRFLDEAKILSQLAHPAS